MNRALGVLKIFLNMFLFVCYAIFAVIFGNFLYGLYLVNVANEAVPNESPMFQKVAIISVIFVFIVTFLLRKFLYLEVFSDKFLEEEFKKRKQKEQKTTAKDDLEIYVNKEI